MDALFCFGRTLIQGTYDIRDWRTFFVMPVIRSKCLAQNQMTHVSMHEGKKCFRICRHVIVLVINSLHYLF
jgi:hypothetical protein